LNRSRFGSRCPLAIGRLLVGDGCILTGYATAERAVADVVDGVLAG
jgi:hypothetical protein